MKKCWICGRTEEEVWKDGGDELVVNISFDEKALREHDLWALGKVWVCEVCSSIVGKRFYDEWRGMPVDDETLIQAVEHYLQCVLPKILEKNEGDKK